MDWTERWRGRRIVVVGDAILDRYLHGVVERISPEAPVPVVRLAGREMRPGGAANVAANVVALGATATLVSLVGADEAGADLRRELAARGIETDHLATAAERPTTVKTRVLARHQQVVRFDHEEDAPIEAGHRAALVAAAEAALEGAAALVISDYAKGLLGPEALRPILAAAAARGVPSVVDPKLRHFEHYQPATLVTPNQLEAARATLREIRGPEDALAAGRAILERLDVAAVLLTRGEEGMLLVPRDGPERQIPALAREVYDVTGAGDTVAAALGAALAAGAPLGTAAWLANAAASLAVGHLGTAAVTGDELQALLGRLGEPS